MIRAIVRMLLVASVVGAPWPARAAEDDDAVKQLERSEQVFAGIAARVTPTVVTIRRFVKDEAWWAAAHAKKLAAAGWRVTPEADLVVPGHRPKGGGSGFVVSPDGYILTLRRVVIDPATGKPADAIDVEVGSVHLLAKAVSLEPTLDLAILKVTPAAPLASAKLGDSAEVGPGSWAIAFGDPDGPEKTMVPGIIVHQPARECYQDELSATYLQTSVPVCDGALGGPLVNLHGEVIGINTRRGDSAAAHGQVAGSGYALPINLPIAIYQSLLTNQSTVSPWLGVSVLRLDDVLRKRIGEPQCSGVYIDNVFDPSPASAVGIKVGDILQSIDGDSVSGVYDFQRLLYRAGAGKVVKLQVYNTHRTRELTAKIGVRPPLATTR